MLDYMCKFNVSDALSNAICELGQRTSLTSAKGGDIPCEVSFSRLWLLLIHTGPMGGHILTRV